MSTQKKGLFICIEGPDGGGKSTQVEMLYENLKEAKQRVITTREPGGTEFGDEIRSLLLTPRKTPLDVKTELALVLASRIEHVNNVIVPQLTKGVHVISDRYSLSSVVYQGLAGGLGVEFVKGMCRWATTGLDPDLTVFMQCSVEESQRRMVERAEAPDSMELKDLEFKETLVRGFKMAESMVPAHRRLVIPEVKTIDEAAESIYDAVNERLTRMRT